MNKNYDEEATLYQGSDNKATEYENTSNAEQPNQTVSSNNEVEVKGAKRSNWKHVAVGATSGLLIGGVATFLMGMKRADSDSTEGEQENNNHKDELSNPEWVDDQIQVATSVSDDMSFGEAFAAARAEVGPGGCFEWHGNVYGTYTADEWSNMTAEQRAEWSDHFNWNHIDYSSSHVAQHSTAVDTNHLAQEDVAVTAGDDIQVVSVDHENNANDMAHQEGGNINTNDVQGEVIAVSEAEPEIEILGVVHDDVTGANIGGISVDGQEVILIDVDSNMKFDYMASDLNNNGQIDPDEVVNIQGQGLTVDDLGGLANPTEDMFTSSDTLDYTSDIYES